MGVASTDMADRVAETFSEHFRQVAEPIKLTERLTRYLTGTSPPNHKNLWGFEGLQWHMRLRSVVNLCGRGAHFGHRVA